MSASSDGSEESYVFVSHRAEDRPVADLQKVRAGVTLDDIRRCRLWGPRIARFSFLLSPFAADEPELAVAATG